MKNNKHSLYRLGGDGTTHFVDEVWLEKIPACDMVGINERIERKETRVFTGTLAECNNYIKQYENRNKF